MGPKNNSSFQSHNYFQRLSKALEFAVSEWLLIFLLFIDACFTYLIAKFASYCQLQGPCTLCSRYDHVLAKNKTGIYWNSICNHHKSEISSVILSHVHKMCESCLLSFTTKTKNKSNDENFRLLVEKLGSRSLLLEDRSNRVSSSGSRICFCCNKEYDSSKNLLPNSSIQSNASESLFANGDHHTNKNEKNIFVDESLESFRSSSIGKNQTVPSSEVEYQKVDVGSESDLPVFDSQSGRDRVHEVHLTSDSRKVEVPEVHMKSDSRKFEVPEPHHDHGNLVSRDTEEVKWQDDANGEDASQITERNQAPVSNIIETPADDTFLETNPPRTEEPIKESITENESPATTNGHQITSYLDLGDAYKLAISTKGRQLLDQKSFKDSSTRVSEDLKILMSHRSNDNLISPKLSFNSDELSSMQFIQRRISLERNESNISLDGSVVSEIDGESVVDRLKRQVEHDKKLMGALYKELEEERNASAVATNQAMAMITRLQEEKAALYTEALQCLRVMEEQAEYNSEALQKANDVIEEKDKQIQELEVLLLRNSSEDGRE